MSNVPASVSLPSLLHGYQPEADAFDEILDSVGNVRPPWKTLLHALQGLPPGELDRRWTRAQEEIRENGVTYSAYDEDAEEQRPWSLDLIPLLLPPTEWESLSAGLVQRAQLLDRLLDDLYGPQQMLTSGTLPAAWLYSHPGFRRRYWSPGTGNRPRLQFYAADLARAVDGRWWVVGDRTDAPLGLGYALENRVTASRMLPNVFREFQVERLAPFFMAIRQALSNLARHHRENPRVVLLSQGPQGPNYFEDAYLARYLGYTLVEGGDLAVRDDRVYMKTLSGLLPVDVIWRRLSDEFCDPLEVRSGLEHVGIPGLFQAVQLGHVAIANGLGTSLVESPSLLPFLPALASRLLQTDLLLPSVATWWCGQPEARQQAEKRRGDLLFQPAFRVGRRTTPRLDATLGSGAQEITDLLNSNPGQLIAQEALPRSTAPVWSPDGSQPWRAALRVFLVAHEDSYLVLPGALVRMSCMSRALDRTVLSGEVCKDAWVLASGPVAQTSLLPTSQEPVSLRRSGADVPSRVADNLFWFGRRMERAQGACRLLRPVVSSLIGEDDVEELPELPTLVHCLAANGLIEPGFALDTMRDLLPTIAQALPASVLDCRQSGNLRTTFEQGQTNASLVRDRLSLDSWRVVHRIGERLMRAGEQVLAVPGGPAIATASDVPADLPQLNQGTEAFGLVELDELLGELIVDFSALDGLCAESMTRSPAWRFLELGRRLERALYVASLIQSLIATPSLQESKVLEALLRVADSLMTYRSRYLAAVHMATTLDLLLTDETNPRSLVFQLMAIAQHVSELPRGSSQPLGSPEDRLTTSLVHSIRMLDVEDLQVKPGATAQRSKLEKIVRRVTDQLPKLSDLVSHRYFIHAGRPQQMAERR